MKIVILDAFRTNPGDIGWGGLENMGELVTYDLSSPENTVERARGAEVVMTNKTVLTAEMLRQLPDLKYIGVLATGINVVDVEAAHELGIAVTNIPAYSTDSVAETAWALLLEICFHPGDFTHEVRAGRWVESQNACYGEAGLIELAGMQMGIVGLGNIGRRVAEVALAFGMKVAVSTSKPAEALPPGMVKMELDELFATSDVVSLHCPLTEDTRHLVDARRLSLMKPSAILINTSRGLLVDEEALAEALNSRKLFAAGVDVAAQEPPQPGNPLFDCPYCTVTPHIAWATKAARVRLVEAAAENLKVWLEGGEMNRV